MKHVNVAYGKYVEFFGVKERGTYNLLCKVKLRVNIIYIDQQMHTNYIKLQIVCIYEVSYVFQV